jgi:O-antigen/teichoic acid export membrane protein
LEKNSNYTQAVWLAISSFSSFALAFVSAAILSRCFDKTEYGTYKQIIYVYGTLQTIFTVGLPGVFSYFIPRYNIHEGKYLVNKINTVFLILGLFFSLSLYFSSGLIADVLKNEELAVGLKIFSVFPLFTLPALGVEGLYTALRKTKYIAIYNTVSKIVMLVCIIIPVLLFDGSYKSAIVGWGVAAFFNFLFAMYMKSKPYLSIRKQTIPKFYNTIFNYSVPLMGASLVGFFIHSSNQFFISRYYGTETFAEYSNGFISIPFIAMIAGSVKSVLLPIFSQSQKAGNMKSALETYRSAVDKSVALIYPLILYCIVFADDIVVFIYGAQYSTSSNYFRISLIRDLFDVLPFLSVILATGHSRVYFKGHLVFGILLLTMSYFFVRISLPSYSIVGLFVFLEIMMKIYFFYFISKKERINLFPIEVFLYIIKILIHISVILFLLQSFIDNIITNDIFPLLRIAVSFVLFYILIFATQKIIGVNYFSVVQQLIRKK